MNPISPHRRAIRARNGLWATFFIMGMVSMAWVPRIPEIKQSIHFADGEFGLLLMASTVGSLTGAQLAGRLIHTFGSRRVSSFAAVVMPFGLIAIGLSTSSLQLLGALFVMGAGYSSLDISSNTQAVVVEKLLKRRWMSTFHALWSSGALVTTVFGGILTHHTTPKFNLIFVGVLCLILYVPAIYFMLNGELDEHDGGDEETNAKIPLISKSVLPLWALGLGLFGAIVAEGATGDWGAILLHDHMRIDKGLNASAFASFSLAMIISRFLGDRILERLGPAQTVKIGGYIGGCALGLSVAIAVPLSSHSRPLSLVIIDLGFAIAGLGMGPIFPAYILAASAEPGVASSVAIARVGLIGFTGFFVGPAITGGLAQITSLPIAMGLPAVMFILSGYQSHVMKVKKL